MEGENFDSFRINSTAFQDFSLPENQLHQMDAGLVPTGNHHHRQPDTGFWASGNPLNGAPENHRLHPEISPSHHSNLGLMNTGVHGVPSYPDTLYDVPLESEFSRLSLSTLPSFTAEPPAHDSVGGGVGGAVSNRRSNSSSVDMSHGIGFSEDVRRMRAQSAARGHLGLYMHRPLDYPASADLEHFEALLAYANLNRLSEDELSSVCNSGRSLNGAAVGYLPRNGFGYPHEIGYGDQLSFNGNNAGLQYRFGSSNSAPLMSDRRRARYRANFSSLEDLRGIMFLVAKDQVGCRFLQNKLEEGNPEEIQMIFSDLKDHICELMIDQFGNHLVQELFEVCTQDQMTELLLLVINNDRNFKDICIDTQGTKAVQKLLKHLTTGEQRSLVISALRRITVALTKGMNGHHVIEHCLKFFSSEDNEHILNVVADHCLGIATDKSGCCVLQQCLGYAQGEPLHRLIAEITCNALILSEHPYGNYVVQYILGLRTPHVTAAIIAQLSGSYVPLSMNKYGSNVVEKCLRESSEDQVSQIIHEIISSPKFLSVLQDPYGNYVAQSALSISKGRIRSSMINLILVNYAFLHSHPHGKRVLARTKGTNRLRVW